jgi:hypothetical protein
MAEASLQSYSMADAAAHVHADNTWSFAAAVAAPDGQTDAAPDAAADRQGRRHGRQHQGGRRGLV